MERLIRRRRECPELGWGRCTVLDAGHPAVLATAPTGKVLGIDLGDRAT